MTLLASMGPSTNVDGERAVASLRTAASSGFNGAVDERRRRGVGGHQRAHVEIASMGPSTNVDGELPNSYSSSRSARSLQWGRRRTSTESDRGRARRRRADLASMGPSTNVDGEISI